MNDTISSMVQSGISISLTNLLIGLSLAILLGLVIVATYRTSHRGFHYERSFLLTLVMIPAIVAVVMMFIGSNLALSLGMVGALSIIRFRTVIKDSRDMVYLFFAIAVGLGCGTYNWTATIVTTFFLAAAMVSLHFLYFAKPMQSDFVLVFSGPGTLPGNDFVESIRKRMDYLQIRSINSENDEWEMVFEVRFFNDHVFSEANLLEELRESHSVSRVSFLAPQLSLPV
jgi:uncharacterized membrane protein YhiD involved in acid resistance